MRTTLVSCLVSLLASSEALAKPKSVMLEVRGVPSAPQAMARLLVTEKPGPFRAQVLDALLTRLREQGQPLEEPDAVDAMARVMFERALQDMAAATDVWVWQPTEAPRGDVLIRETVKLWPGQTSSGFTAVVTVSPKGKRIDLGFLDTPCTVRVSVAKSEADWHAEAEQRGRWVASLHPVRQVDGVALVALSLLSPSKGEPPAPRHERPVWLALFRRETVSGPWELVGFEPAVAREQRLQESNLLPGDGKAKLSDAQRQLVLALRMHDVRLINPNRKALSAYELAWVSLEGLSGRVVDAKHVAWLAPWLTSDVPLVRAVALLRTAELGGEVKPADVVGVLQAVRAAPVQAEAMRLLSSLVGASAEAVSESDKAVLARAPSDEVRVLGDVARVRRGDQETFFTRGKAGWQPLRPAP
jgi:hypothetical protein